MHGFTSLKTAFSLLCQATEALVTLQDNTYNQQQSTVNSQQQSTVNNSNTTNTDIIPIIPQDLIVLLQNFSAHFQL